MSQFFLIFSLTCMKVLHQFLNSCDCFFVFKTKKVFFYVTVLVCFLLLLLTKILILCFRPLVLSFNIPGVTSLTLSRQQIVGIYNGTYRWWNHTTFRYLLIIFLVVVVALLLLLLLLLLKLECSSEIKTTTR